MTYAALTSAAATDFTSTNGTGYYKLKQMVDTDNNTLALTTLPTTLSDLAAQGNGILGASPGSIVGPITINATGTEGYLVNDVLTVLGGITPNGLAADGNSPQ